MKISKVTPGFVVQTYDTKTGRCVEQSFVAGDDVAYEKKTAMRSIGGKRKTPTSRSIWCSPCRILALQSRADGLDL